MFKRTCYVSEKAVNELSIFKYVNLHLLTKGPPLHLGVDLGIEQWKLFESLFSEAIINNPRFRSHDCYIIAIIVVFL